MFFFLFCAYGRSTPVSLLRRFEGFFTDIKFRVRGKTDPKQKVVIVDVDDRSLGLVGRWPWRRDFTALLIDDIFQAGAKQVVLDMLFPEAAEVMPEELHERLRAMNLGKLIDSFNPELRLAKVLRVHREHLVGGWQTESLCKPKFEGPEDCPVDNEEFRKGLPEGFSRFSLKTSPVPRTITPIPSAPTVVNNILTLEQELDVQGFVNADRDTDGIIRRVPLLLVIDGKLHPSLALVAASRAMQLPIRANTDEEGNVIELRLGPNRHIPVLADGIGMVNYRGPAFTYPYVHASDVLGLSGDSSRDIAQESVRSQLEGAVVVLGVSALAASDITAGPFDSHLPGVEVHATMIDNLMSGDLMSKGKWSFSLYLILLLLSPLAMAKSIHSLRPLVAVGSFVGFITGIFLVDVFLLFSNCLDLPTGYLYLSLSGNFILTLIARFASEEKQRKFLKTAFGKYVSPTVVDEILQNRQLTLGGRKETLTLLFCDVRDFTKFSETRDAKVVGEFLNEYLDLLTEIVFLQGGTVDKYIGDAIMAFWGAPLPIPDHARRALKAAQEIQRAVASYHDYFEKKYNVDLRVGIGINTGPVAVGNLGSRRTFSYTAVGDSVNLAARLESATKEQKVSCLASAATIQSAYPIPEELKTRRIGTINVKGKAEDIEIFELIPPPPSSQIAEPPGKTLKLG